MSFADAGSIRASIDFDARGLQAAVDKAMARATKTISGQIDQSMDQVEGRMKSGFRKVGIGIAGILGIEAISTKLVQAAGHIFTLGSKTEATLNTFQAVTKATGEEMARVSEVATALGNDISIPGASAADAALAMTELAKSGLSVEESMAAAKGTLQLAAAAQIDAADAATIQGSALNAFRLEADQAARVSDVLANSANASAAEISDTAEALAQAGAVANSAGLSIEETTTFLSQFANAGIRGSDAGTLLKTMLMRLTAPTGQAAAVMKDLGINVFDANGEMVSAREITAQLIGATEGMTEAEKAKALSVIFGADAVRGANVLLEQGIKVHDQVAAAIGREGAAAEVAAARSKGLTGAINGLISMAESLAVEIYQNVAPSMDSWLRDVLDKLPGVLDAAGTYLGELLDNLEPAAEIVAAFIEAAHPGALIAFQAALAAVLGVTEILAPPLQLIADLIEDHEGLFKAVVGPIVAATVAYQALSRAITAGQNFRASAVQGFTKQVDRLKGSLNGATTVASRFRVVTGGMVGALGGPWGLALGAATIAIGYFAQKHAEARANVDALKSSLDEQTGALTKNSRQWAAKRLREEGALEAAEKLGISLPLLTDAVLGEKDAIREVNALLEHYRGETSRAAKADREFSGGIVGGTVPALTDEQKAAYEVRKAIGDLSGTVKSATREKKLEIRATRESTRVKEDDTVASSRLAKVERQLSGRVADTSDSLREQERQAKDTERAIKGLNDAVLEGIESEIDFEQAVDDLRKHIKSLTPEVRKNAKALDTDTQAGRDTYTAFIDLVRASKNVAGGMEKSRDIIYKHIRSMVDSDAKARRLTDQFFELESAVRGVPNQAGVRVKANVDPAMNALARLDSRLDWVTRPRDARITITQVYEQIGYQTIGGLQRAGGGPIFGPGTGTSDSIPAMLSNGEHVFTAREVDAAGGHGNILRLRKAILDGAVKFATGGGVNLPGRPMRTAVADARTVQDSGSAALVEHLEVKVGTEDDLPEALDETLFHLRRIRRGGRYVTV